MNARKIEKFFKDTCTPDEIKEVKEWFKTPEGQIFLKERLDQDIQHLQGDHIKPMTSELRSEKMWNVIEAGTTSTYYHKYKLHRKRTSYWPVVASVILLLVSAMFYLWNQVPLEKEQVAQSVLYITGNNQQKSLTLRDGTKIRLSSNSQILIPEDFGRSTREVELRGEAFFDVVHNEEKPFIVHTVRATIKDLGTAFNIRAMPNTQNVQIAVTEGEVSIWSDRQAEEKAIELTQGQFGYLDFKRKTFQIDHFGVNNYLSWMNGRLQFKAAPLEKVSTQLSRIFDISFTYSTDTLQPLSLTANFKRGPLEEVLKVIAMTLRIDYKIEGQKVIWLQQDGHNSNKK